jgi:hypothetical protein
LVQSEAEANTLLKCTKNDKFDDPCIVDSADLTKKTLNEEFSFLTTREQRENATGIYFDGVGRVAHLPLILVEEFSKLAELRIYNSEIPIVKKNLFGPKFSQIEKLALWNDKIEIIEEESFKHLPNLWGIDYLGTKLKVYTHKYLRTIKNWSSSIFMVSN